MAADDLSNTRALVVDGNPTSRSILVNQLREFGVPTVEQAVRVADARKVLELKTYDIVLCEQHFQPDAPTGQELLDDLRRNQLLPFATVFIMVTNEASYSRVAEAAESALDGYLIKPHAATALADRLYAARHRKAELADIYAAIESGEFARGADLCLARFNARKPYWLYAARIGAELLIRTERYPEAQQLYEAVVEAKTLPWAKLGVARAQLEKGETQRAIHTLENLIGEDPQYADAYDVLGRAQFELGNHEQTLAAYKMACTATPHSITRLQNLGHMCYYSGDREEAERCLGQCTRLGLDSKMFDPQTLVLLAFARLEAMDRKGLGQCRDDIVRLLGRQEGNRRLQRLSQTVETMFFILDKQFARAVDAVRALGKQVRDPAFDTESATNLISLAAQLAHKAIQLDDIEPAIDAMGMRFSVGRSMTELLAGNAALHPPYAERIRTAGAHVLKLAETAMSLSLGGDPAGAVRDLLRHGHETLNARLIETAHLVVQRYPNRIPDAKRYEEDIIAWRETYGVQTLRPTLNPTAKLAGSLSLRGMRRPEGEASAPGDKTAETLRVQADSSPAAVFLAKQQAAAQQGAPVTGPTRG